MARRQVIVQLDDELTAALDALAARQEVSRSELIRRAAVALLRADETLREERRFVESYLKAPQDAVLVETARRLAAETAPDW